MEAANSTRGMIVWRDPLRACGLFGAALLMVSKIFEVYGSALVADILLWSALATIFSGVIASSYRRK